jgi:hypothetical protein
MRMHAFLDQPIRFDVDVRLNLDLEIPLTAAKPSMALALGEFRCEHARNRLDKPIPSADSVTNCFRPTAVSEQNRARRLFSDVPHAPDPSARLEPLQRRDRAIRDR